MLSTKTMNTVARATIRFPDRGLGVLVPGGLILTAAHVVEWTHTGLMALGNGEEFVQKIEAGGQPHLVYPFAVEPVADLAVLGALDGQWFPEAEEAFERFCEATAAVLLATTEFPYGARIPAHVFTHTGQWITGHVAQWRPESPKLSLEPDEAIQGGTSGGPVVTDDGRLLGVVSWSGQAAPGSKQIERDAAWVRSGAIPRPHLTAPVWLVPQMLRRRRRKSKYYEAALAATRDRASKLLRDEPQGQ